MAGADCLLFVGFVFFFLRDRIFLIRRFGVVVCDKICRVLFLLFFFCIALLGFWSHEYIAIHCDDLCTAASPEVTRDGVSLALR
jgi:hypothetical protein